MYQLKLLIIKVVLLRVRAKRPMARRGGLYFLEDFLGCLSDFVR